MMDFEKMCDELSRKTVKELRQIARDKGICLGYSGASKKSMVGEIASQIRYREREEGGVS